MQASSLLSSALELLHTTAAKKHLGQEDFQKDQRGGRRRRHTDWKSRDFLFPATKLIKVGKRQLDLVHLLVFFFVDILIIQSQEHPN